MKRKLFSPKTIFIYPNDSTFFGLKKRKNDDYPNTDWRQLGCSFIINHTTAVCVLHLMMGGGGWTYVQHHDWWWISMHTMVIIIIIIIIVLWSLFFTFHFDGHYFFFQKYFFNLDKKNKLHSMCLFDCNAISRSIQGLRDKCKERVCAWRYAF